MTTSESKGRFFFTKRIDSNRIANWNALVTTRTVLSVGRWSQAIQYEWADRDAVRTWSRGAKKRVVWESYTEKHWDSIQCSAIMQQKVWLLPPTATLPSGWCRIRLLHIKFIQRDAVCCQISYYFGQNRAISDRMTQNGATDFILKWKF